MKLQRIFRAPMIMMGLGVALLLASPVRGQQEVAPDTFDINPGTPNVEVAVAVQVPAPIAVQDNGVAQAAIVPASNWDGTFAAPLNAVDVTMVVILALGTGLVALYTVAATRRQRRRNSSLESREYPEGSGATTH
jgi:hypothetical protein